MTSQMEFIVPVYRSAPFLKETLSSLLNQKDPQLKISVRAVEFPKIQSEVSIPESIALHVVSPSDRAGQGIADDWEDSLKLAQRPIATLAHSDDLYAPTYSQRIQEAFERFPEAGIAFTSNDYVTHSPKLKALLLIKKLLNPRRFAKKPVLIPAKEMLEALKLGSFIPCPTVAYHLPVIQNKMNGQRIFNPGLKVALDWDAWITLAERGVPFIFIPEPLVTIRVHSEATTQSSIRSGLRKKEELKILERIWGPTSGQLFAQLFHWGQKLQELSK